MMGKFVDPEVIDIETDDLPTEKDQQVETVAAAPQEEEWPEKYRGKSVQEIIKMHQEAEKLIGRQGSEVGELRHIVDDFIKSQQTQKHQEAPVEEADYFTDPQRAVDSRIESHPAIKQAQEAAVALKRQETASKLKTAHPDFEDIASDPAFADWVGTSKVRAELYYRADKQFDFDAANELLSTWKERKELSKKMTEVSAVDRKQQLKAATTSVNSGSDESVGKKIYRRADIIKLIQTDPSRYDALQEEILTAYREGRVK